ncbi:MAG: murein biosynthesis integral membrane protein MurJ [Lachnospirales bacterium]
MESSKTAVKTVFFMISITLLGKVTGLIRDMFFLANFGTESIVSESFIAANSLPKNFLDIAFASVITSSFIPIFNDIRENKGEKEALDFSGNFITIITIFSAILVILCTVFSGQITSFFYGGFESESRILIEHFLQIFFPLIIFSGITFTLAGILQSYGEFNIPASLSLFSNAFILIYYIFFIDTFSVDGLALAYLISWIIQFLVQIPYMVKNKLKLTFKFNLKDENIRKIGYLALPLMISTWLIPINYQVNISIAGNSPIRIVPALNTAYTLYMIVAGVIILSISNLVFPKMSKQTANNDEENFGKDLNTTLRASLFILIPIMIVMITLSEPMIKVLYERGKFNATSTELSSIAFQFYSFGVLGYCLQNVIIRGFYAKKNWKIPLYSSILGIVINFVISVALQNVFTVAAYPIASSISITTVGIYLLYEINKINNKVINIDFIVTSLKLLVSGFIMALVINFIYNLFNLNSKLYIVIVAVVSTLLGSLIYLICCKIFKIKEVNFIGDIIKKRK